MSSHIPFERLIFFGDSLMDAGTVHDLTSRATIATLPSQSSGYEEAFTHGETHATVAADLLGVREDNYAVGYAHALGSYTVEDFVTARYQDQVPGLDLFRPDATDEDREFDLYLGGQIDRYLEDAAAKGPVENSAAAFGIGLNDYSEFRPVSEATAAAEAGLLVSRVVGATISAAFEVAATGVETIILYEMPTARFFAYATLQPEDLVDHGDQLISGHNTALVNGAALLEAQGITVEFVDLEAISAEIMADPATFGLRPDLFHEPALLGTGSNPTLVELPDGTYDTTFPTNPLTEGVDLDELAFIDYIHPSAAVHGIWGVFSATSLASRTRIRGDSDDVLGGREEAELILSGAGDDDVSTSGGNDAILAGLGEDTVRAGTGKDIVAGGSGDDLISGNEGADVLADGAGDDRSYGGRGSDLLIDGSGSDTLKGALGSDAFLFLQDALQDALPNDPAENHDNRFYGGKGNDTLYLVVDEASRALVEAELDPSARSQALESIGLRTCGIEDFAFLDPGGDAWPIDTPALLEEAALWGLI